MHHIKIIITLLALILTAGPTHAALITFEDRTNGEWITNQYIAQGLTISAENYRAGHPDKAIIFDSDLNGTRDPDLEYSWSGGNLMGTQLGNLLIIAENDADNNGDGYVDNPDDEARRPAGHIDFAFNQPMSLFGFDFIDIDSNEGEDPYDYLMEFYLKGALVGQVSTGEYSELASALYDPSITHGNHFANRYQPITAAYLGSSFDQVVFQYGGSGAIDNVLYAPVPEPASLLLMGGGLAGLVARRRKKA